MWIEVIKFQSFYQANITFSSKSHRYIDTNMNGFLITYLFPWTYPGHTNFVVGQ